LATYIALFSLTDAGIKAAKDSPRRLDAAKKLLADMGGEMKQFYMVMGDFDFVGICEAPDDAVMARYVLQLGGLGFVRTKTLRHSRRPLTAKSFARWANVRHSAALRIREPPSLFEGRQNFLPSLLSVASPTIPSRRRARVARTYDRFPPSRRSVGASADACFSGLRSFRGDARRSAVRPQAKFLT
jgi:uncharacterized protein with GYD domain